MATDNDPLLTAGSPLASRILFTFRELRRDVLDLHAFLEMAGDKPPAQREAVLDAVADLVRRGVLQERGSDFYSLSESGRLALAGPRDITLLGRPNCHLCDDAQKIIASLAAKFGLPLREVNIDEDFALRQRYGNDIPVLFLGHEEIARHSLDANLLEEPLAKIAAA
jgi:thiol-disulfide isomerase/thioredoxin